MDDITPAPVELRSIRDRREPHTEHTYHGGHGYSFHGYWKNASRCSCRSPPPHRPGRQDRGAGLRSWHVELSATYGRQNHCRRRHYFETC